VQQIAHRLIVHVQHKGYTLHGKALHIAQIERLFLARRQFEKALIETLALLQHFIVKATVFIGRSQPVDVKFQTLAGIKRYLATHTHTSDQGAAKGRKQVRLHIFHMR